MARSYLAILALLFTAHTQAFSVSKPALASLSSHTPSMLYMSNEERQSRVVERGVSVDQDGKSNVWAIEPKMEIDTKSADEKTTGQLIAVGGFAAFSIVAVLILNNLPDPNQF